MKDFVTFVISKITSSPCTPRSQGLREEEETLGARLRPAFEETK